MLFPLGAWCPSLGKWIMFPSALCFVLLSCVVVLCRWQYYTGLVLARNWRIACQGTNRCVPCSSTRRPSLPTATSLVIARVSEGEPAIVSSTRFPTQSGGTALFSVTAQLLTVASTKGPCAHAAPLPFPAPRVSYPYYPYCRRALEGISPAHFCLVACVEKPLSHHQGTNVQKHEEQHEYQYG